MDDLAHYMENLIQTDNSLVDKSAKYIRSSYSTELPASSFLEVQKKRWWLFGTKIAINIFFSPCRKVRKCNWDFILSQWHEINSNKSAIETDCCPHSEHLKDDLEKSINTSQYNQLTFFRTEQIVTVPISKRIGRKYRYSKIYAYCPICSKIFCIGGIKKDYRYMNLIECSLIGRLLVAKADSKASKLQSQRVSQGKSLCMFGSGGCYSIWKYKEDILKTQYDIIWYSPATLHPGTRFD